MALVQAITPCLWFDDQAEEAAKHYTAIFRNSRIREIARFGKASHEHYRDREGKVMTVAFELDGQPFTALNGGPMFKFNESISLQVICETQEEIDYYWERLGAGGDPAARQCGWLKDKFGLSWQVFPKVLIDMITDPDAAKSERATEAMLGMKKFDIGELERAFAG